MSAVWWYPPTANLVRVGERRAVDRRNDVVANVFAFFAAGNATILFVRRLELARRAVALGHKVEPQRWRRRRRQPHSDEEPLEEGGVARRQNDPEVALEIPLDFLRGAEAQERAVGAFETAVLVELGRAQSVRTLLGLASGAGGLATCRAPHRQRHGCRGDRQQFRLSGGRRHGGWRAPGALALPSRGLSACRQCDLEPTTLLRR